MPIPRSKTAGVALPCCSGLGYRGSDVPADRRRPRGGAAYPAEPFADSTRQCCILVGPPTLFPEAFWNGCAIAPGKTVRLYALVPLYEDEMTFKLEQGSDALFDKMDARKLTELIDPERRSVLAKRFWIV